MDRKSRYRLRWFLLGTLLLGACGVRPLSYDRHVGLETFDAAWKMVYESHFDTTFNGVDWPALRDELRPTAEQASDRAELRDVIEQMLDRLGQSHFSLIPQEVVDTLDPADGDAVEHVGDLGFDVRLIGEQVLVTEVDPEGPAWASGVRTGWVVRRFNTADVDSVLGALEGSQGLYSVSLRMWARMVRRMVGRAGTTTEVEFLDAADQPVTLTLTRRTEPGQPVKLGNLPTFFARMEHRRVDSEERGIAVGVIWFNVWMAPLVVRIDSAVDDYRNLDGLVVDLRGNGGGLGVMVSGVAGHFFDERVVLGTMRTRNAQLRHIANPRRVSTRGERVSPFAGPVAVLVDGVTGSASELFAGGMQSVGRVRVFGEPTMGAVLPARMDRLPNGDVLYHAFADFVTSDGITLEGRGVIPDVTVPATRDDLIAGRDAVLEAALHWIAEESAHERMQAPAEGVGR